MRSVIAEHGIAVITIRPAEFWNLQHYAYDPEEMSRMRETHETEGFAFLPREDGDGNYGITSIRMDYLAREGWAVKGYETSTVAPFNIAIILTPSRTSA